MSERDVVATLADTQADFAPRHRDLDAAFAELSARLDTVTDSARCFLPSQAQRVLRSLVPDMRTAELRRRNRGLLITKLVDLVGDRFVLDERHAHKRPDWTFPTD